VFDDLSEAGEAKAWCDITWGGVTKKTR